MNGTMTQQQYARLIRIGIVRVRVVNNRKVNHRDRTAGTDRHSPAISQLAIQHPACRTSASQSSAHRITGCLRLMTALVCCSLTVRSLTRAHTINSHLVPSLLAAFTPSRPHLNLLPPFSVSPSVLSPSSLLTMPIRFILMVNKQGQTRLAQYYETMTIREKSTLESEMIRKCLARGEDQVRAHTSLTTAIDGTLSNGLL